LVGKAEYMRLLEDLFYSFTFGGEALSLSAAKTVINKMNSEPVLQRLWDTGQALSIAANKAVERYGLSKNMRLTGMPPWRIWQFMPHKNADEYEIKTFFLIGMLREGVLINASHNVCYAHDTKDVLHVVSAYEKVLGTLADLLRTNKLRKQLGDRIVKPVFSVR
jgi:glutamate-1-semialdehyde 2,1-aminomutase